MQYIIQTLPYEVYNESEKINQLFAKGLSELHIRKPLYTKKALKNLITNIDQSYHSKIVIHSHFGLLKRFKLKGIHINYSAAENFFKAKYYAYLKQKYNITISTTSKKVLKKVFRNALIDYLVVGPLYKKYSEETVVEKFNFFETKNDLNGANKPVYASGCFSINNINTINKLGFDGIVLQSFIWKSDDIFNAFDAVMLNNESKEKELVNIAI